MKLKLDENLGRSAQDALREAGHDVSTVLEQGLSGAEWRARVVAIAIDRSRAHGSPTPGVRGYPNFSSVGVVARLACPAHGGDHGECCPLLSLIGRAVQRADATIRQRRQADTSRLARRRSLSDTG